MIKKIIKNNRNVINNFGYLSILQLINILLPLATYPYLIRILGAELYGTVIFAQAIITYFSLLVNFGFNITATNEVAKHSNDKTKLSEIVSSIFLIKFFLSIISFIFLLFSLFFFSSLNDIRLLILISFSAVFYELLFPVWYFQGVDKMKYITLLVASSRLFFTVLIFIFINESSDFLNVPIINGLGFLIMGVLSLIILKKREKITFIFPSFLKLKYYFLDSLPLFISSASIRVYVNANRVLVGAFLGMNEVAYYDLGEKVLRLIKIPVGMLGQSAFPTFSREKNIKKINRFMWIGVIMTLLLVFLTFLFSEDIVLLLGGKNMLPVIDVLKILSISAIMVAFSQFLGTSRLIVFGYKRSFTLIITSSGLVYLFGFLCLFVLNLINIYSLAWLAVFVEFWVALVMLIINYKKNILYESV
jgi:O-antigen/teichoic acid export membrane protein